MNREKKQSALGRKYGWRPQLPDARDEHYMYRGKPHVLAALPPVVDLRPGCPAVYDQGSLGSCTANAIGGAHQMEHMKQGCADSFAPSRLFIYYGERAMEGTINEDAGAIIRDGMSFVADKGACRETLWPYDVDKFKVAPPAECYTDATAHKVISYHAVAHNLNEIKACLAEGYPVVFGFTVYESFESAEVARTGVMPMPNLRREQCMGGHAVLAVGYDDTRKALIVRNSWGAGWGDAGYFYMPYGYITTPNLASDFWTLRLIADTDGDNPPAPTPTPTPEPPAPTPTPTPRPPKKLGGPKADCAYWQMANIFLDDAVARLDKGASLQDALVAGLKGLHAKVKAINETMPKV